MKKLLLIALLSVSLQLFSQPQGEMKFVNTNLVEYNGERIKIKEAKRIAKEAHPLSFKQFSLKSSSGGVFVRSGGFPAAQLKIGGSGGQRPPAKTFRFF